MVKPGEVAAAHRHAIGALRFVIQGAGAYTTVEGERFVMEPNDLVLTPNGTWHDHGNESDQPMIWIDGHDLPLVRALNVLFFEKHESASQTVNRPEGYSRRTGGAMRPRGSAAPAGGLPYIYKGAEALETLRMLGAEAYDPCDGRTLDYVNPFTGGPTLPTIACRLHLLAAGERMRKHRHTASTIYHVVEGAGMSIVGDKTFHWEKGDIFVVPNWSWHTHMAGSSADAILFSASDEPVMAALSHLRVEDASNID
jgi:gentisate 1,2-dioxygenase